MRQIQKIKLFLYYIYMEALLNSLNIHHLGDDNYCSPLDSPELMSKINRFVDNVICESNQKISLIISGYNNESCFFSLERINIFFCSSVIWAITYYNLTENEKISIKRHIRETGANFNFSQFGFFVNQRINHKIKTKNDIIRITGYEKLGLNDDYWDFNDDLCRTF
tara:strand:+ start:710 stop:1207 length:498 start_codon:yes stop_codon:yes gene_type:complete